MSINVFTKPNNLLIIYFYANFQLASLIKCARIYTIYVMYEYGYINTIIHMELYY